MKFNKALFGDNAMEDIDLLKALFGDKLIEAVKNNYDKYEILLKEESVNNNYSISISNVPDYAIAIKTDNFPDLKGFFECSSDRGQCKCADFVIVADKNLVFIELSSTKKQENEVKAQLKGAECVVEYCKSIIKNFYQTSSFSTQYNHSFESRSDAEILEAQKMLTTHEGIFCEPASATSLAGIIKSIKEGKIKDNSTIVCTLTGHGLKDPDTAISQCTSKMISINAELDEVKHAILDNM
jgi:hypothetical protein